MRERLRACLVAVERPTDDLVGVLDHVDEDERKDPHREHRQRDARTRREQSQPANRQAEIDGEPGDRAQQNRALERQALPPFAKLGEPNRWPMPLLRAT
jgi:hypothetical protein